MALARLHLNLNRTESRQKASIMFQQFRVAAMRTVRDWAMDIFQVRRLPRVFFGSPPRASVRAASLKFRSTDRAPLPPGRDHVIFRIKIVLFSAHGRHGVVNLAILDFCPQKRSQDLVRKPASVRWPGFGALGRGSPSLAPGRRLVGRHVDWTRRGALRDFLRQCTALCAPFRP